jgi:hypothetical protein
MTNTVVLMIPLLIGIDVDIRTNQHNSSSRTITKIVTQKHRATYTNALDGQVIRLGADYLIEHSVKREVLTDSGWVMQLITTPSGEYPPLPQTVNPNRINER